MSDKENILFLIPVLVKWWKHLLIGTVAAMLLTAGVMLMQPNYYQSESTFYPVSTSMLKPIINAEDRSLNYYGDDHDIDRLLSIGKSRDLSRQIIEQYELAEHYEILGDDSKSRIKLNKQFNKLYSIVKTKYDAIKISVEDKDPEMAAKIVEGIRTLINENSIEVVKNAQLELLQVSEKNMKEKKERLENITDQTRLLQQKHNIYDTEKQAEALATIEAASPNSPTVKKMIASYTDGVALVRNLENEQLELSSLLVLEENNYRKILSTFNQEKSALHIIDRANVPIEKARPKRSLYVLGAGIVSAMFGFFLVLLIEQFKNYQIPKLS